MKDNHSHYQGDIYEENDRYGGGDVPKAKSTDTEEVAGRIGTVLDTVKKVRKFSWKDLIDGMFKIMFLIICVLGISFGWYCIQHTDDIIKYFIDRGTAIQTEQHDQRFFQRMEMSRTIKFRLDNMYREVTDVDRIYIIEFHNGSSNLADLPFCRGTMTYEYFDESRNDICGMKDNWGNINLGNFFNTVCAETRWSGSVDDVREIDVQFYHKLMVNDIKNLAMVTLYNPYGKPIGVMGIGTGSKKVSKETNDKNMRVLLKYSQSISTELSMGS